MTLLHLHIPKTGGSSLMLFLQRQYGDGFYRVPNQRAATFWDDAPLWAISQHVCISGHFPFGMHLQIRYSVRYLTFVREPVDRLLSLYHYFAYNSARGPRPELETLGFERFAMADFGHADLAKELRHFVDNDMVRRLSGLGKRVPGNPYRPVNADDYQTALDNLKYFVPVGLTERYDESMARWAEIFGWPDTQVGRLLHQPDRPRREELDADLIAEIEDRQSYDCALYGHILHRDWMGKEGNV